jgi:hypothetical protein
LIQFPEQGVQQFLFFNTWRTNLTFMQKPDPDKPEPNMPVQRTGQLFSRFCKIRIIGKGYFSGRLRFFAPLRMTQVRNDVTLSKAKGLNAPVADNEVL